ncbi:MAG: putative toxin-antitoxin system toxin component, PIN family [Acidobacteriota bacterium]|mgnify:FL=1
MSRRIVIDTNVLLAALRSRRGASFTLLSLVGGRRFEVNVSVPLVPEYEDAAKRMSREIGLSHADIDDVLDYVCRVSRHRKIFFLWRPFLSDPKDDHILELAVESDCDFIVTHNVRDFRGADRFGLRAVTPHEFLKLIGVIR